MSKGAPEVILGLCRMSGDPKSTLSRQLYKWESNGNRVIASCFREITNEFDSSELEKYSLKSFESSSSDANTNSASDSLSLMEFNGLTVFRSTLKHNASAIVNEIIQSGMHFKMITGDALNTSVFIYKGITKKD